MKTIAILSQKGGVGKTTLATCLAVAGEEDGKKTAIFDIDPQATSSFWQDTRKEVLGVDTPAVVSLQALRIPPMIKAASEAGTDMVIIDAPAVHRDIAKTAAENADFIFIPFQAAVFDTVSMISTVEIVQQCSKPFALVLNFADFSGYENQDAIDAAKALNVPLCDVFLYKRKAYKRAQAKGLAVQEFERDPKKYSDGKVSRTADGKASKEIIGLYAYMCIHLYTDKKGAKHGIVGRRAS